MVEQITIRRPDDWHLHLRDGDTMRAVVGHTARTFGRAMVMPNLVPPVLTADDAQAYRARIMQAVGEESGFDPKMTLYLAPQTAPDDIDAAVAAGVLAVKLYPAGATTNSDAGVVSLEGSYPVFERMESLGMPLLIHGESTDASIDVFDRERVFIEQTLAPLVERFSSLPVVLEHITTSDAVEFILGARPRVAASITAHHLLMNRNAIFDGGIRPHHYCLPILKRERHREALVRAATSGDARFFAGTDSAPHDVTRKEQSCGCAGCYTAFAAIELYAQAFEDADSLAQLEGFASCFGADFYGLARNDDTITLARESWEVPTHYPLGDSKVIPLFAGEHIRWKVQR
ncbi:MAG: dihydroorotase [Nannocystaceae bacterium]